MHRVVGERTVADASEAETARALLAEMLHAHEGAGRAVGRAVTATEAVPTPDPIDVFDYAYKTLSPRLAIQREAVRDRHGGE